MTTDAAGPPGRSVTADRDSKSEVQSHRMPVPSDDRVMVWGVPFVPWTMAQTVAAISGLIRAGRPSHFITANTHYVMLSDRDPALRAINDNAAFIVADGMPLVWASRLGASPLPERVAGSDLIFELSREAAAKGYRLFFLGGGAGVAEEAGRRLTALYPGLEVVGAVCPPFRPWTPEDDADLIDRIRAARPDVLITALAMPKADHWLTANLEKLEVPVVFNCGAAVDFAAGNVRRAPHLLRSMGLEWAFRLWLEPRRLMGRYLTNAWFVARMIAKDLRNGVRRKGQASSPPTGSSPRAE
jgi:N-acetylglucosaminyldiphosphoundecaprenol N-acetyl-beta-D-mannosaminyltransferase